MQDLERWKVLAKAELLQFLKRKLRGKSDPIVINGFTIFPEHLPDAAANLEKVHRLLMEKNESLSNLHPYAGVHEREYDSGTMSSADTKKLCTFFCKHRDLAKVPQVEEELLRCTPEVLVLSLDNLHELLIKQPHPTDYLILEWLNMVMIS